LKGALVEDPAVLLALRVAQAGSVQQLHDTREQVHGCGTCWQPAPCPHQMARPALLNSTMLASFCMQIQYALL
jgi:hypothetical protein